MLISSILQYFQIGKENAPFHQHLAPVLAVLSSPHTSPGPFLLYTVPMVSTTPINRNMTQFTIPRPKAPLRALARINDIISCLIDCGARDGLLSLPISTVLNHTIPIAEFVAVGKIA